MIDDGSVWHAFSCMSLYSLSKYVRVASREVSCAYLLALEWCLMDNTSFRIAKRPRNVGLFNANR